MIFAGESSFLMSTILVTGAAGFIGAHAAAQLARAGHRVIGVDSYNAYYPTELKHARVAALLGPVGVPVHALDLCDTDATVALVRDQGVDVVLHLAAQAGVRHSVQAPMDYVRANLVGFGSILEACRLGGVKHLLYASSSSVYGWRDDEAEPQGAGGERLGFAETDRTDEPASFYAATKKANEAMAHATAQVHGLPVTGLRFFTVYGPWGRPDMAYWTFSERIRQGLPLPLFGRGELLRDFTYVDDVVEALARLIRRGPPVAQGRGAPAEIFNVGHRQPVRVLEFVRTLEDLLGTPATLDFVEQQIGDVPNTCADPTRLTAAIGPEPWRATPLREGLGHFVDWLKVWSPRDAG